MKGHRSAALVMILAVVTLAHAEPQDTPSTATLATDRCRTAFPQVTVSPSDSGGWLAETRGQTTMLCLFGALDKVNVEDFRAHTAGVNYEAVVVRSTGGPVSVWLAIAEHLVGYVNTVIVDEACFSSCANYIVPIAEKILTTPGTLIAWHGGPTFSDLDQLGGANTIEEILDYDDLSLRTQTLYARLRIGVEILSDTSQPPDGGKLVEMGFAPGFAIAGYALSPRRLKECYGFHNVSGMWHAGDDRSVAALAQTRNPALVLLESPFPDESCRP